MVEHDLAADVTAAARRVVQVLRLEPPHVRPWLRGIESEAEHICLEVSAAGRRADSRFMSWLMAGLGAESEERTRESES